MSVTDNSAALEAKVRSVLARHTRISDPQNVAMDQDLYASGLTSFNAVQMMLSLEGEFDVVFPSTMLNRRSFSTLQAIVDSLAHLTLKSHAA